MCVNIQAWPLTSLTRAPVVAVLALSLYFGYIRRRRIQQANLAYINQQQYNHNQGYPQGQFQGGYAPQYPPQSAYGQQSPYPQSGYDNGQAYAPVSLVTLLSVSRECLDLGATQPPGPPPQAHVTGSPSPPDYYAPPTGPPPNNGMNKGPM